MRIYSFRGGIQPNGKKELTKEKEIQAISASTTMVYPLSDDGKTYAFPVVCEGEQVQRGQKIAEGNNVTDAVFSSVSGEVIAVEPHLNEYGYMVRSIVIRNDGCCRNVSFQQRYATSYKKHLKMNYEEIKYVLIDAVEDEPYLTCEYRRMKENGEDILLGIRELLTIYSNAVCYFCISDDVFYDLNDFVCLLKQEERIEIKVIKNKYPKKIEKVLPRKTDLDVSLTLSLNELCSFYNQRIFGVPDMERLVTISGDGVCNPGNYIIQNGTSYEHILQVAGIYDDVERIISGGVLSGKTIVSPKVSFTIGTGAIICLLKNQEESGIKSCVKCGRCVDACPQGLVPMKLALYAAAGNNSKFEKWGGLKCIECGCCTYKCPSKIHLKEWIRGMKQNMLQNNLSEETEHGAEL